MSGVVLFRDTFADAVIPWKVTAGTATLARTTTDGEVHAGAGALKLTTSTVAAQASEVHRYHGRIPGRPVVVFGGRMALMDENISNIAFYLGWRDGTTWYRAKMLHVLSSNVWQYDAGGSGSANHVTLLTRDPSEVATRAVWHSFALAADFDANRHAGWVVDEQSFYSMVAATALRSAADASSPYLLDFAVETTNLGGTPSAGVIIFDELWAVALEASVANRYPGAAVDAAFEALA